MREKSHTNTQHTVYNFLVDAARCADVVLYKAEAFRKILQAQRVHLQL
jgi:hypothetical protein